MAAIGKHVVGAVGLYMMPLLHRDQELCRVLALSATADYARRSVGRRPMNAAEAVARRAGCRRMELTTAAERTGAHAFYRRLGFKEASQRFIKTVGPHPRATASKLPSSR